MATMSDATYRRDVVDGRRERVLQADGRVESKRTREELLEALDVARARHDLHIEGSGPAQPCRSHDLGTVFASLLFLVRYRQLSAEAEEALLEAADLERVAHAIVDEVARRPGWRVSLGPVQLLFEGLVSEPADRSA